jgi:transcriptional regulator with XRE-family HTH domain
MTAISELKCRWMRDPKFKKAYEASEPEWQVARALIEARIRANLTQAQVAKRMRTTQSVVSRMESGHHLPSMSRLQAYAKATGGHAEFRIVHQPSRAAPAPKTARSKRG